jgi:hypothetical protein
LPERGESAGSLCIRNSSLFALSGFCQGPEVFFASAHLKLKTETEAETEENHLKVKGKNLSIAEQCVRKSDLDKPTDEKSKLFSNLNPASSPFGKPKVT